MHNTEKLDIPTKCKCSEEIINFAMLSEDIRDGRVAETFWKREYHYWIRKIKKEATRLLICFISMYWEDIGGY